MKSHICWCVIDYTLMVIDYQWLISKNTFPKVIILQVTCFWRFFQKSQLFKWLVLKKLPRVTSFDLSYQEIINMWPWHEFEQSRNVSFNLLSQHHSISFNFFYTIFWFISLHLSKSFCSNTFSSKKSSLFKNLCCSSFSFSSPFAKRTKD